jgi:hypothetical protein
MNAFLILATVGLAFTSVRLYVLNLNNKKQAEQATTEYKKLKDDYFELMRDLRDARNKNVLLESVIRTIKSK